ncbi:unnamed protein product, partial [Mesorhabditis belari]|uniref:Cyclin-like domain-containing protein n=1 Tax=Mesorhabditis belari TaxID=2138241 RepID=A0AAF3F4R7_9BILA
MAGNFWQSSHYEQWIFDKTNLLRMRHEDLKIYSEEEYGKLMIFFSNLVQHIALETQNNNGQKVKMQVIATAFTYFKRFYARRSLKDIDPFVLAPTCIYLASKVEEFGMMSTTKLMSSVANVMKQRWCFIQLEVSQRVGVIHEAEFIILEIMDCCLIVYHAYRPLTQMIQDMKTNGMKDIDELEATSWKVCNDTMRGDFVMLYPPHMIALGCIIQAALMLGREKEIRTFMGDLCVDFEKVYEVVQDINKLYTLWKGFDEQNELQRLIDKLPKPSATPTQPPVQQHQQQVQQMPQQMNNQPMGAPQQRMGHPMGPSHGGPPHHMAPQHMQGMGGLHGMGQMGPPMHQGHQHSGGFM